VQRVEKRDVLNIKPRVGNRREASREQVGLGLFERGGFFGLTWLRNSCEKRVGCAVDQDTCWLAVRTAQDLPSGNFTCIQKSSHAQGNVVGEHGVPVDALQGHRSVWEQAVKLCPVWERLGGPVVLVPPSATHPRRRRRGVVHSKSLQDLFPRSCAHQIRMTEVQSVSKQVAVGVNEPWVHGCASQVAGRRTAEGVSDFVLLPHRNHHAVANG